MCIQSLIPRRLTQFAVLALAPIACTSSIAAPGDLDTTFGEFGRVLLDPYPDNTPVVTVHDMIRRPDGRIVLASTGETETSTQVILTQLEINGELDPTFGNGGLAESWFLGDRGSGVIELSNGSLVVAGSTGANLATWRFNSSGVADASFGTGGIAWRDLGGEDHAVAVVEQSTGHYVVAGTSQYVDSDGNEDADIVLARFSADGLPDDSFGIAGTARLPSPEDGTWEIASGLVLDPDGNLIVVGNRYGGSQHYGTTVVARLTPDGILDSSFGSDGQVEHFFGTGDEVGSVTYAIALDTQGSIVIGGGIGLMWWTYLVSSDPFVARFLPDGTLDNDFGATGIVRTTTHARAYVQTLLIEPDDSVVAGLVANLDETAAVDPYETAPSGPYMLLSRIFTDGTLDSAFGVAGTATIDFGHGSEAPNSIAAALVRNDEGSVVIAGNQADSMALARVSRSAPGFPGYIGISTGERQIDESAGSTIITVRRTGGSSGEISVHYETHNGTATEGQDYVGQSGRLSWADGDVSEKMISVSITDDNLSEGGERFHIALSDTTGGALLAANETTVVINADNADNPLPVPGPKITQSGGGGLDLTSLLVLLLLTLTVAMTKKYTGRQT